MTSGSTFRKNASANKRVTNTVSGLPRRCRYTTFPIFLRITGHQKLCLLENLLLPTCRGLEKAQFRVSAHYFLRLAAVKRVWFPTSHSARFLS